MRRFLNGVVIKNLANGKQAIIVDTQCIESTISKEYENENIESTTILSPSTGNSIIVYDVFLAADGNIGAVELDWQDNGDPIARIYTSQFSRASFTNMTNKGEKDKGIVLNANVTDKKLFLLINYVEVEGD